MPSHTFKMEYLKNIYAGYHKAVREEKSKILDELCRHLRCHRKHAIRLLAGPRPDRTSLRAPKPRGRTFRYGPAVVDLLRRFWEATGYLCGPRLKAAIPLWIGWVREAWSIDPATERLLSAISPSQIDRRLAPDKIHLKRRLYGTTKPGAFLKHMIPVRTDFWNIHRPGFMEIDLVSHSGASASGDFLHTLNSTDILTLWGEQRAVLGKSELAVVDGLRRIEQNVPFALRGIDSDNGSEFINNHLWNFCRQRPPHKKIQFTRSRPYKKDDNAHVEQKNWTRVRKRIGYDRYDTPAAQALLNDIYDDLRLLDNLFLPSQKLLKKVRRGSRLIRRYDAPRTAFDRVKACPEALPEKVRELDRLLKSTNPFHLAQQVERKLRALQALASRPQGFRQTLRPSPTAWKPLQFSRKLKRRETIFKKCNQRWLNKITKKGALAR